MNEHKEILLTMDRLNWLIDNLQRISDTNFYERVKIVISNDKISIIPISKPIEIKI